MWHCLLHHFLWASVIFVELEFAKFVAKISNWNFLVVSFFPCWNICAEEDCLSVDFKHVNSSFAVAFILLCQKRENLIMCHQPIVPPKLPFTICKLFTILESLPLCNKTDLHRLTEFLQAAHHIKRIWVCVCCIHCRVCNHRSPAVTFIHPWPWFSRMHIKTYGTIGSLSNRPFSVLFFCEELGVNPQHNCTFPKHHL